MKHIIVILLTVLSFTTIKAQNFTGVLSEIYKREYNSKTKSWDSWKGDPVTVLSFADDMERKEITLYTNESTVYHYTYLGYTEKLNDKKEVLKCSSFKIINSPSEEVFTYIYNVNTNKLYFLIENKTKQMIMLVTH